MRTRIRIYPGGRDQRRDRPLALLAMTQQQGDAVLITVNLVRARSAQPWRMIGEVVAGFFIASGPSSIRTERHAVLFENVYNPIQNTPVPCICHDPSGATSIIPPSS
jgi:hypothetical protein